MQRFFMNLRRTGAPSHEVQKGTDSKLFTLDKEVLLSRKLEIVYGYMPSGLLATAFVSMIIALFLGRGSSPLSAVYWGVGMAIVILLRLADFMTYRKLSNDQQPPSRWKKRFLAGVTSQGILWGIGGYCLFPDSPLDQMFLVSTFGGMAGGAMIFLSPMWPAFIIYSATLMAPVCLRLLLAGHPAYWMTGFMLSVYLFSLMLISIKTRRWTDNYLITSMEKESLAVNLQTAFLALEGYREDLERLVDERTRELSVSNLQLQREIHEKDAEKLKSELSEARFWELAELLPEMIFETDLEGALTFLNRKGEELTGLSSHPPPTGASLLDIFIPGERREVKSNLERVIAGEAIGSAEFNALRSDGTTFPVLTVSSPIIRNGVACGLRGILMDTTRIKELELSLHQSQKMEAVGLLAGGIAHDFNNMLMAIVSYGGILQMSMTEDDPLRTNVDKMLTVVDRAAGLTQSLLAFSRKQVINLQPCNLNDIIRKVEKFLARVIGEDIEIQASFMEDPLYVNADSGQIEQVLMNLATNARDAMPHGGLLSIVTESTEFDTEYINAHGYGELGRYARFSVSDTGAGMDATTTKRIFEPFFTTKEVGKGTGLGLAVVYGIVKQHGGYINVYSEPGKGTTFRTHLPLLKGGERAETESASRPMPTKGTETILLAEDEAELRKLLKSVLMTYGYMVIDAVDGEDAISKFTENRESIQLLLLDLIMPKKSGKDAYDEIRMKGGDVRTIFISGYPQDVIQRTCLLEEGCDLIKKPISPQNLLRKIREVLDRK
jgi:PAS domain S-box-containing protein